MDEVPITPGEAMRQLDRFDLIDPAGRATLAGVCQQGPAFQVNTHTGPMAYVQDVGGGIFWIVAAGGKTQGEAGAVLGHLEKKAAALRCYRIGFQTQRRGLGRIAKQRGYSEMPCGTGWTYTKELKC